VGGVPTKVEMTRISSVAQGVGASNNDGSISLACKVNSSLAPSNFIVCNGGLGSGEIVVSKPITNTTQVAISSPEIALTTTSVSSTPIGNTVDIETTSVQGPITTFWKLKLNGIDIWIPCLTSDPSV
jgi:hypothetical protein